MLSKNELKSIKSLKVKKYRMREKRFIVEGAKNVLELIHSDFEIELIIGLKDFYERFRNEIKKNRFEIVSSKILEQVGTFKTNETCLAVAKCKEYPLSTLDMKEYVFVLDNVNDPGNLGTIIRTLDWFGFNQLVCSESSAEFYNPKVINSSMGSFKRIRVYYTNLVEFLNSMDIAKYGAEMGGQNMFTSSIMPPSIIVMGSESHGISSEVKEVLTDSIAIPKSGEAESLNVAIAMGIIAGYLRI